MTIKANLGIDLGTSTVIVSYYSDDKLRLVYPEREMALIPSCVYKNNEIELIGKSALNMLNSDPANTFKNYKLYIGIEQPSRLRELGFSILPKELTRIFLKSLKEKLTPEVNESCPCFDKVVITVPHRWGLNSLERAYTELAAREAGFNNISIQSEPVMGAAFYFYEAKPKQKQKILICDFGAGTFDLTICEIKDAIIEPIYNDAIPIAGDDIDNSIIQGVTKIMPDTIGLHNYRRLKYNFEENIKKSLNDLKIDSLKSSVNKNPDLALTLLDNGKTYKFKYKDLKEHSQSIFKKMEKILNEMLELHNDIDCIVSIGGGSLFVPYRNFVKDLAKMHEKSTYFFKDFNSNKAISYGAALVANEVINIEEKVKSNWGIFYNDEEGNKVPLVLLPKGTLYNARPSNSPTLNTSNSKDFVIDGFYEENGNYEEFRTGILFHEGAIPQNTDVDVTMFIENGLVKLEIKYLGNTIIEEIERVPTLKSSSLSLSEKLYKDPEKIFL